MPTVVIRSLPARLGTVLIGLAAAGMSLTIGLADGAAHYWSFDETSGDKAEDFVAQRNLTIRGKAYKRGAGSVLGSGASLGLTSDRANKSHAATRLFTDPSTPPQGIHHGNMALSHRQLRRPPSVSRYPHLGACHRGCSRRLHRVPRNAQ